MRGQACYGACILGRGGAIECQSLNHGSELSFICRGLGRSDFELGVLCETVWWVRDKVWKLFSVYKILAARGRVNLRRG